MRILGWWNQEKHFENYSLLVFLNFSFKGLQGGSGGKSACHPTLQPSFNPWNQVKAG